VQASLVQKYEVGCKI